MNKMEYFKIIRSKVGTIFKEFVFIVESIKDNFEEEQRQHPRLTMRVVDYHLDIVRRYASEYNYQSDETRTIDENISSVSQSISSFYREFDNPFRGSERWYQRIIQLLDQLAEEGRELDRLIEMSDNGELC